MHLQVPKNNLKEWYPKILSPEGWQNNLGVPNGSIPTYIQSEIDSAKEFFLKIFISLNMTLILHVQIKPGIHQGRGKPKDGMASSVCFVLKNVFQFLRGAACSIRTVHERIPRVCLTFICQQPMARITAASEAYGSVRCTVYTCQGASACLCLKCIPSIKGGFFAEYIKDKKKIYP